MYIVTGSTGLIGFSTSEYFLKKNIKVIGIDNDMRAYFFGKKSSNKWKEKELKKNKLYSHYTTDIRNRVKIPVILAGGLNHRNVNKAIEKIMPFGVDVCSGVRTNDKLDLFKLKEFFNSLSLKNL